MQNLGMGFDARAVTNAILDLADETNIEMSNLAMNKILFFCHVDSIVEHQRRLLNATFEAWKFGPVLPVIYHQFKKHGSKGITSRATKLCRETGSDIVVSYSEISECLPFLKTCFMRYGTLPPSALVSLSHAPGEPWDIVWNSRDIDHYSMKISDELIRTAISKRRSSNTNENIYVH